MFRFSIQSIKDTRPSSFTFRQGAIAIPYDHYLRATVLTFGGFLYTFYSDLFMCAELVTCINGTFNFMIKLNKASSSRSY